MGNGAPLSAEEMAAAIALVGHWRVAPGSELACVRCGAAGLRISDHSARPHAEWYRLACSTCGLEAMITLPLGAPVPGLGD